MATCEYCGNDQTVCWCRYAIAKWKEKHAAEIVKRPGYRVTHTGVLACDNPFVRADGDNAELDGDFSAEELRGIASWMDAKHGEDIEEESQSHRYEDDDD